jgi:hypothetical protein
MNIKRLLKGLLIAAAAAPTILPTRPLLATEPAAPRAAAEFSDVRLAAGGSLNGQVVDSASAPVGGAVVTLSARGSVVAQTTTDKNGRFAAPLSKGGVYLVSAAGAERVVRTWTEQAAPPAAREGVLLVADETAVRGQAGGWVGRYGLPIGLVGGGLAGIIVATTTDDDQPAGS